MSNVARYSYGGCECGRSDGDLYIDDTGEYVKFDILQQLQDKIRAVISRIDIAVEKCDGSYSRVDIANELRELSALK